MAPIEWRGLHYNLDYPDLAEKPINSLLKPNVYTHNNTPLKPANLAFK